MNIKRIEFDVTYRCNSHCKHCHVEEEKRRSSPAVVSPDLAMEIVHKVAQVYHPSSLMTFGGEPLLFPDVVCAIHAAAQTAGIPQRDIITNAGVAATETRSREVARRLADSGVNGIWISVDAFHQEFIPLERVKQNVQAFKEAGIPRLVWNPSWAVSMTADNPYNRRTRAILDELAPFSLEISEDIVVQPQGNALICLKEYLPPRVPFPKGSCTDVPYSARLDDIDLIGIEPDGSVSICNDWTIGNAAEDDILGILARYDPYTIPEARAILEGGVETLFRAYQARGIQLNPAGYYSICDLCTSLRRQSPLET